MGQVYLVRHGQASFGADDYDRLSATGWEQGRRLGAWLQACGLTVDVVGIGPARRHRETAQACFAGWEDLARAPADWRVEPDLAEYAFDEVIACLRPDLATPSGVRALLAAGGQAEFDAVFLAAMRRWMENHHPGDYRLPWPEFRARCLAGLERLTAGTQGRTVVVFTSGGPIAALAQHALGLPDAHAAAIARPLMNGGVTRLTYRPGRYGLCTLNSVAHLDGIAGGSLLTYR